MEAKLTEGYLSLLLSIILCFSSCSSDHDEIAIAESNEIREENCIGTDSFIASISKINSNKTRGGNINSEEDEKKVVEMVEVAKVYLKSNGIDYTEYTSDPNDPRIAVFAMGLAEYDKIYLHPTSRTTLGGCILQSIGLKDLANKSLRAFLKAMGKKVFVKFIPYAGWVIFTVDVSLCLSE